MEFSSDTLTLEQLYAGKNVRVETDVELPSLRADIIERGLLTPLTIWQNPETEKFEILCGHRRFEVLKDIAKSDKDKFNALFPHGKVPTLIVRGVTKEKAQTLKVDGGTSVELKDPFETQLCANLMFDDGASDATVANALSTQLCRTSRNGGMKKETRAALKELVEKRNAARLSGDYTKVRKFDKEIFKTRAEYHRGHIQCLRAVHKCPELVMACKEFEATQIVPKKFENVKLIKLTNSNISKLLTAFREDLEIRDGNTLPMYSKMKPGPHFNAAYNTLVATRESGTKKDKSEPRLKSMSATDMCAEVENSVWQSQTCRLLTWHHAGKKVSMAQIKVGDKMAAIAEHLSANHQKEWATLVARCEKEMQKIAAQKGADTKK